MDITMLDCFVALSKYGKFSAAADELYISQSSLSRSIKSLEIELGVVLFERSTKLNKLTPEGEAVLPYAQSILDEYDEIRHAMQQYQKKMDNRLHVSTISFLNHYHLSSMLFDFYADHPEISFNFSEDSSIHSLEKLKSGQADVYITFMTNMRSVDYHVFPLIQDTMVLLVADQHPLAGNTSVNLRELKNERFQFLDGQGESTLQTLTINQCKNAGFNPVTSNYLVWLESIPGILQRHMTISLLPETLAKCILDPGIKMLDVEGTSPVYLSVIVKDSGLTPQFTTFLDYARNYVVNCGLSRGF